MSPTPVTPYPLSDELSRCYWAQISLEPFPGNSADYVALEHWEMCSVSGWNCVKVRNLASSWAGFISIWYVSTDKPNWLARCKVLSDPLVPIELQQYRLFAVFTWGRVTPNASTPRVLGRMSWCFNTMFKVSTRIVDTGPSFWMRRLWILWRHEHGGIESCDVIDDINRRTIDIFL